MSKPQEFQAIDTPPQRTFLAIESGGSGTRLALANSDGTVIHEARCSSASPLYRDRDTFGTVFSQTLEALLSHDDVERSAVLAVGLAGPADAVAMHAVLEALLPGVPRLEHSEGELGLARYDLTQGIALVAGTGASCHALDARGARTAIGGYGPQFGDEGSAYWIGREGLKAAFRAEQGRIEPTMLLEAALEHFQIESPWELLRESTSGGHIPAPRIAGFAAVVDQTAEAKDPRACALLDEAGHHLGTLILDMVSRTHFEIVPVPLVLTGGVFHSGRVLAAIEATLSQAKAVFSFQPVVHEPISGLIRILLRDITIRTT